MIMKIMVFSTFPKRTPNLSLTSFSSLKVMKSTALTYENHQRLFPAHRFVAKLPSSWRERFVLLKDKESSKTQKLQKDTASKKSPLTFEEFKKKHLKTFEEFKEMQKKYYDAETIIKGYEGYCKGSYKSYLIEHEQINAGIIF